MEIRAVSSEQYARCKTKILRFAQRCGEGRITSAALRAAQESDADLERGSQLLLMMDGRKAAGLSLLLDYGRTASFFVVHPDYRGKEITVQLIRRHIQDVGAYSCTVAVTNTPSLKQCFRAGLTAVDLFTGPTGKPTLLFISPSYESILSAKSR
ncbi:hypothetical protein [Paenibacillus gansuensis]|uniref:N-acetyltransferase domain-containing protein n=1 Tax=Paenibacillus gansuensis TaxID=306542 RepID=A0ABW5PDQ9_9BACL